MAKIARLIAAAGALAGGYMQGKKMQEDSEFEQERRDQERAAFARADAERQAAADTMGKVGTETVDPAATGGVLSREQQDMMASDIATFGPEAGKSIIDSAARDGATPEARAAAAGIKPTTYTQEKAQADYVRKLYSIDPAKAAQAEATQITLDEGRDKAETRKKLKIVDNKLREYGDKTIPKGEDGQPMISNDAMLGLTKMRTILLSQHGLYDQAMATAKDGMQYATAKIQADTEQRKAAVRDAVSAYGMGDTSKALSVYKQFVPDGADPVSLTPGKDGSLVLSRKSALDGAPLPARVFKDQAEFLASLNALSDGNALAAYVERTFQHDIESRKVKADEKRADASATSASATVKNADLAEKKDKREETRIADGNAALSDMDAAERSGDAKGYAAARNRAIRAGIKLEKPEATKADFTPNPMGMGGTVKQIRPDGSVTVTPIPMDAKGAVSIAAPGATKPAPAQGKAGWGAVEITNAPAAKPVIAAQPQQAAPAAVVAPKEPTIQVPPGAKPGDVLESYGDGTSLVVSASGIPVIMRRNGAAFNAASVGFK